MVSSDLLVRCSRDQKKPLSWCKNTFLPTKGPTGAILKLCQSCRDKANKRKQKYRNSAKGQATEQAYAKSQNRTDTVKRYAQTAKGKASSVRSSAKFERTFKGKEVKRRYSKSTKASEVRKRYSNSEKGKALGKRMNSKPINKIRGKIYRMLKNGRLSTKLISINAAFASDYTVRVHFESTFEQWMHWGNHGKPKRNAAPKTTWSIGHRIPVAVYDSADPKDVKACHSLKNMRAQCAKENAQQGAHIPDATKLLELSDVWPRKWKNQRF